MVNTSVTIRESTQDKVDKYYKTAWIKCYSLVQFPEMSSKLEVSLQIYLPCRNELHIPFFRKCAIRKVQKLFWHNTSYHCITSVFQSCTKDKSNQGENMFFHSNHAVTISSKQNLNWNIRLNKVCFFSNFWSFLWHSETVKI